MYPFELLQYTAQAHVGIVAAVKLATSYERIIRFLAFIELPLSVLLFFTAEEVTLIIFGNQWLPSVARCV